MKRRKSQALYTVRLITLVSKAQYQRLCEQAAVAGCSVAAMVRILLDKEKV